MNELHKKLMMVKVHGVTQCPPFCILFCVLLFNSINVTRCVCLFIKQPPSYEDAGDDGIVPSTPTLFVPRRTDGFGEAVSSPQVPSGRFIFSDTNPPTARAGIVKCVLTLWCRNYFFNFSTPCI